MGGDIVAQRVEVDALTTELVGASATPRPDLPARPESSGAQVRMSGVRERVARPGIACLAAQTGGRGRASPGSQTIPSCEDFTGNRIIHSASVFFTPISFVGEKY